jgi:hypothetical protein
VGPHESMTYGVHGIYLKFGSFNGIDPIVPKVIGFVPNLCGYSANGLASVMRLNSLLTTVKLLWRGAEFWKESMDLLRSAEQANGTSVSNTTSQDDNLIWRRQCMHLCSYCIL